MSLNKLPKGEWIVVCDGRKALFLENEGEARSPHLVTRQALADTNPPTREQGVAPPGRTHQSVGSGRSAVEQTDWHTQAEERFLAGVARHLDRAVNAGETRSIVLVAPPTALGTLRPAISAATRAAIRAEVAKDYVNVPVPEIGKLLLD